MSKSARNATGASAPGQIVNNISDYIKRAQEQENPKKKMTFEEWLFEELGYTYDVAKECRYYDLEIDLATLKKCWESAQENV